MAENERSPMLGTEIVECSLRLPSSPNTPREEMFYLPAGVARGQNIFATWPPSGVARGQDFFLAMRPPAEVERGQDCFLAMRLPAGVARGQPAFLDQPNRRNEITEHNSSDINSEDSYKCPMVYMKEKLDKVVPTHSHCCIYRVPHRLRQTNEKAYTPELVSIGPFHRGKEILQTMEEHKWRYLRDLLHRSPQAETESILDNCGKVIWALKDRARKCYAGTFDLGSNEFVEIMLLDGCFILGLFLKYSKVESRDNDDPIFNTAWIIPSLQTDLILLENQIPLIVLESLFDLLVMRRVSSSDPAPSQTQYSLLQLTFNFFESILNMDAQVLREKRDLNLNGEHLLDVLRSCYLPLLPAMKKPARGIVTRELIQCATQLSRAGINFTKGTAGNLFDVEFSDDGVLTIPPLRIYDSTNLLFRNLIALEQCGQGISHHITSYVLFMDFLIDSAQDVELLEKKRIIENYLGSEEDVSVLFNDLCKEVATKDICFSEIYEKVDAYYSSHWHKWKATLKRDYFNNPWTTISVFAAIVLLILTFLQTIFTIFS